MANVIAYKIPYNLNTYRCGKCGCFFGAARTFIDKYCRFCGEELGEIEEIEINENDDIDKIVYYDWQKEHQGIDK